MSFCRWSSNDYQCDVYVYEDAGGGFTTHVAGSRYVFAEPLPDSVDWVVGDAKNNKAFFARMRKVSAMCENAAMQPIGLPHDGESFNDSDAAACADRLESLRELGYMVPQYAIDALREEAAEEQSP